MKKHTRIIGDMMQTERREDGRRRLLRDLNLEFEGDPITIPAGTITDFSSIPWYGRILVRWSKVDIAAVVHDWYYQTGAASGQEQIRSGVWWLSPAHTVRTLFKPGLGGSPCALGVGSPGTVIGVRIRPKRPRGGRI